jgi:hypothetical protein
MFRRNPLGYPSCEGPQPSFGYDFAHERRRQGRSILARPRRTRGRLRGTRAARCCSQYLQLLRRRLNVIFQLGIFLLFPRCTKMQQWPKLSICKVLIWKDLVGASGFELEAFCAQGSCKKSILLVRLALFCVMVHGFGPNLAVVGPKFFFATRQTVGRRSQYSASSRRTIADCAVPALLPSSGAST